MGRLTKGQLLNKLNRNEYEYMENIPTQKKTYKPPAPSPTHMHTTEDILFILEKRNIYKIKCLKGK